MSPTQHLALSILADDPEDDIDDIIDSDGIESDEPQMETIFHVNQMILLITSIGWWWRERNDFFVAGNISIYYEQQQVKEKPHKFRGPDFFVVLNTRPDPRKSWVVWQEDDRFPNLIIELLSKGTSRNDKIVKKKLYQNVFKTPEYFWFHPEKLHFAGFRLVDGLYQPILPTVEGWMWSEQLDLFLGVYNEKLRFFSPQGQLVPTPHEAAAMLEQEQALVQQQAQIDRQQRELAERQQQILIAKLRARGIDPDKL